MNGGYISMPERLSNKLMESLLIQATSVNGSINGLIEVCQFLDNASKIGKPVVMSGVAVLEDMGTVLKTYHYCCYISLGLDNTFILLKEGEAFVMRITNVSKGTISYHGIDRA